LFKKILKVVKKYKNIAYAVEIAAYQTYIVYVFIFNPTGLRFIFNLD